MHIVLLKACLFNYVNVKHVKPSCNFNFWCLEWLMNLNYKVRLEFFWKIWILKKKFRKKWVKKYKIWNFCKYFEANLIFWNKIWIWNVFSFHLMYILSLWVKNYNFSKTFVRNAWKLLQSGNITFTPLFEKKYATRNHKWMLYR